MAYSVSGASTFVRQDEAIIVVDLAAIAPGWPRLYSWASFAGGDIEATDTLAHPGGTLESWNLGGVSKRSDVTLQTQYSAALHPFLPKLERACGRGAMSASWTPLDADGNPNGGTVTLHGTLKAVNKPSFDANSSSAVFLGLTMACDSATSIGKAPKQALGPPTRFGGFRP